MKCRLTSVKNGEHWKTGRLSLGLSINDNTNFRCDNNLCDDKYLGILFTKRCREASSLMSSTAVDVNLQNPIVWMTFLCLVIWARSAASAVAIVARVHLYLADISSAVNQNRSRVVTLN